MRPRAPLWIHSIHIPSSAEIYLLAPASLHRPAQASRRPKSEIEWPLVRSRAQIARSAGGRLRLRRTEGRRAAAARECARTMRAELSTFQGGRTVKLAGDGPSLALRVRLASRRRAVARRSSRSSWSAVASRARHGVEAVDGFPPTRPEAAITLGGVRPSWANLKIGGSLNAE